MVLSYNHLPGRDGSSEIDNSYAKLGYNWDIENYSFGRAKGSQSSVIELEQLLPLL